ncbi:MAG: HypC/HybG/HupF family hydrogenase formation chaperone [Planctomycetota bacterium]
MCLAVPAQIMQRLDGERAVVDLRGSRLEVSTVLTPQVDVADWVLLHTGFAIECLSPEAAARLLGEQKIWESHAFGDGPTGHLQRTEATS